MKQLIIKTKAILKKISVLAGKPKASTLVVALIILGIILVSTLSISLVAVQERKASIGESKSNQAYSIAETGVEKVMQAIKGRGRSKVDRINIAGVTCNSADGVLAGTADGFEVELRDAGGVKIRCDDSSAKISSIKSVKSVGTAGGNQRAVEVAMPYYCMGLRPSYLADPCEGDLIDLDGPTNYTVVDICSAPVGSKPKCEYTCRSGSVKSGNDCVLPPDSSCSILGEYKSYPRGASCSSYPCHAGDRGSCPKSSSRPDCAGTLSCKCQCHCDMSGGSCIPDTYYNTLEFLCCS